MYMSREPSSRFSWGRNRRKYAWCHLGRVELDPREEQAREKHCDGKVIIDRGSIIGCDTTYRREDWITGSLARKLLGFRVRRVSYPQAPSVPVLAFGQDAQPSAWIYDAYFRMQYDLFAHLLQHPHQNDPEEFSWLQGADPYLVL